MSEITNYKLYIVATDGALQELDIPVHIILLG